MMMIHRQQQQQQQQHPTVDIPPWDPPYDDPTAGTVYSPQTNAYFSALHRFLPSCETELGANAVSQIDGYSDTDSCDGDAGFGLGLDSFGCDNFRMYEFKVRRCGRGRSHDWTECPFAHPGEKARRRDPRKFHYSGTACPDFRRGCCRKGDLCEFAHGVFECWLHPARYRTQPCKDGSHCQRRVCFFAHSPDQLRVLPESPPGRLTQLGGDSVRRFGVSPTSVIERSDLDSPPVSPSYGDSLCQLVSSVRGMQIGSGWAGLGSGSPRSPGGFIGGGGGGGGFAAGNRTPTQAQAQARSGLGLFDPWETGFDVEVPMERVESGKGVRAQMYAKLSEENSLHRDRANTASPGPDFGWVSELVK